MQNGLFRILILIFHQILDYADLMVLLGRFGNRAVIVVHARSFDIEEDFRRFIRYKSYIAVIDEHLLQEWFSLIYFWIRLVNILQELSIFYQEFVFVREI